MARKTAPQPPTPDPEPRVRPEEAAKKIDRCIAHARLLVLVLALRCTSTAFADSYAHLSIAALVAQAESIVVASVHERSGDSCELRVSEKLFGTATESITFTGNKLAARISDEPRIYFLGPAVSEQSESISRRESVLAAIDIRQFPEKYLSDPDRASHLDFIEMLGYMFRDREIVGQVTRKVAVDHLRSMLKSADPALLGKAIWALRNMAAKEPLAVIPLIQHSAEEVRWAAIVYLEFAPDPAAVDSLCALLSRISKPSSISTEIGRALTEIGDVRAVPVLEKATRRGLYGNVSSALAMLGNEHDFPILLEGVFKSDSMDCMNGLRILVSRSNMPSEAWMTEVAWTESSTLNHKTDWLNWWKQHYKEFKVIKTGKEAFRTE